MKKSTSVTDLEKLEVEAAASILIYDRKELKEFMELYNGTVSNNELGISGPFATFLDIINKALEEGLFNEPEEGEDKDLELEGGIIVRPITKRERLLNFIIKSQYSVYDQDDRDKFNLWFSKVVNSNIEESLAEDVINHYLWENYLAQINTLNKSGGDFREKLRSIPTPLEIKDSKSQILGLDEIDISTDSKYNKLYSTGLEELDQSMQSNGTNLVIIAARPGVGKTLFMLQQAIENARGGKRIGVEGNRLKPKKSLFISLEMSEKSVHDRICGYLLGQNLKDLKQKDYIRKVEELRASDEYKTVIENLKIVKPDSNNGNSILKLIDDSVSKEGFEFIALDYLQLLKFSGKDEWGSIREATNSLKGLAFKRNILIVTGSQVSRSSTDEGLSLTDLFGGSSIEADADGVIGMEALRERKSTSNTNLVTIKILKNREGPITSLKHDIDYSTGRITLKEDY